MLWRGDSFADDRTDLGDNDGMPIVCCCNWVRNAVGFVNAAVSVTADSIKPDTATTAKLLMLYMLLLLLVVVVAVPNMIVDCVLAVACRG